MESGSILLRLGVNRLYVLPLFSFIDAWPENSKGWHSLNHSHKVNQQRQFTFLFPFVMVCTSRGRCLYAMGITIKSRTNCFECSKSHNSATKVTRSSFKRVKKNPSLSGTGPDAWLVSRIDGWTVSFCVVSPCLKIDISPVLECWLATFGCRVYPTRSLFKVCNIFILLPE